MPQFVFCNTLKIFCISLFSCFILSKGIAQERKIKFDNISVEDGLSSYFVNYICQDSHGFLWFGTKDGLNRYDGFTFIKYHSSSFDSTSISHNYVNTICEDPTGNGLWIGTNKGLNFFDFRTEQFTCIYNDANDSGSLCHNNVSSVAVCSSGGIWVGTRNGLDRMIPQFDNETEKIDEQKVKFIHYTKKAEEKRVLSGNNINCIYQDNSGSLWIGYESGKLDQLIIDEEKEEIINHQEYKGGVILDVAEDKTGAIWFVSNGAGLVKYDPLQGKFMNCLNRSNTTNRINAICKGAKSSLWLGTYDSGLTEISFPEKVQEYGADASVFKKYKNTPGNLITITDDWIRCLYMDKSGVLWAGTRRNGIVKISFLKDYFDYHSFNESNEIIPDLQEVNTIIETRDNLIWVGTANGLFSFNQETKEIKSHKKMVGGKLESPASVFSLCEDKNGNLWIGTYENGLYKYDLHKNKFTHFYKKKGINLSSNQITSVTSLQSGDLLLGTSNGGIDLIKASELEKDKPFISPFLSDILPEQEKFTLRRKIVFEDSKGIIWITTVLDGLYKYNPSDKSLKHYPYDEKNPYSISDDHIASICESKDGLIWIATDKGLDAFDVDKEIFTKYYTDQGLPDNTVIGVKTDKNGHVWALTRKWISRLNPKSGEIKNFNYYHRVVTGLFTHKRICETKKGRFFVGTQRKGFFSFDPDSIINYPYKPPVVITDMEVSGASIPIGKVKKQIILNQSINNTKEVELKYDQNNLSFSFSALSYINQEKNQYACQLEGAQDNWLYLEENQRSINYFNLLSGTYTFKVKAANYDGVWNNEFTSLEVTILPPWWRTWWAYVLYFIVLILLLLAFYHYSVIWISLKNNLKLEKMEKAKMLELNQLKLRFFTNISHEFRTPLTLLLGPLENLIYKGTADSYLAKQLGLMHGNANRLLRLINQLMDFRKVENREMKLNAQELDIIEFTNDVAKLFEELAKQHQINFQINSGAESLFVWFDKDKFDKILFNLLSNAFKFTPNGGDIKINIKCLENQVEISIEDTGKGMTSEHMNRIFDRFYQIEQHQTGTGIGLSLSKSFADLHQGNISVTSVFGKGSCFVVRLPLGREHLSENEIFSPVQQNDVNRSISLGISSQMEQIQEEDTNSTTSRNIERLPLLLIVEDNISLRTFIKECLEHDFRIVEAANGKEAFDIAVKLVPELIISDVMMPEMDGIELCNKIKSDDRTSHIPIVLLTALSAVEDVFTGYKSGADEYIPKPFNPKLLEIRVKKLIESNRNLKKRFQKEISLEPKDITIASADEKLLEKIMLVIEKNLGESDFTVEKMGAEIGISRVHLNRKIKSLTDQTAVDFIRTIRMKQAAKLITSKKLNISEVAYTVGFSNPISFGRSFKKHFGCSPSDYEVS